MRRAIFEIPETKTAAVVDGRLAAAVTTITSTASASSLPVNLFVSSVLATTTVSMTAKMMNPNEIKCEICEDGEEDATSYCVQCSQYFCDGCLRVHKKATCDKRAMSLCPWRKR